MTAVRAGAIVAAKDTKTQRVRKPAGGASAPAKELKGSAPKKTPARPASGTKQAAEDHASVHLAQPEIAGTKASPELDASSAALNEVLKESRSLRAAIEPTVKPPGTQGAELEESVDS